MKIRTLPRRIARALLTAIIATAGWLADQVPDALLLAGPAFVAWAAWDFDPILGKLVAGLAMTAVGWRLARSTQRPAAGAGRG